MMPKNQLRILDLFRRNIFTSKTIRGISITIKKSYPKVYEAVDELEKKKVINVRKVGNAKVCELNLSKDTISIFSFLDEQEAISKNIPHMLKIIEFKDFRDDVILVGGSYAKGKQTSKSDVDVLIITKTDVLQKQRLIENLTKLFLPKVHPVVVSYKDFIDMLLDKNENYGKEIFRNKLLFKNSERYYDFIKEAIENGFRG